MTQHLISSNPIQYIVLCLLCDRIKHNLIRCDCYHNSSSPLQCLSIIYWHDS